MFNSEIMFKKQFREATDKAGIQWCIANEQGLIILINLVMLICLAYMN